MKKIYYILPIFLVISITLSYFIISNSTKNTLLNYSDKVIHKCVTDKDQTRCFNNYFKKYIDLLPTEKLVNQLYTFREDVPKATEYCHEVALKIGYKSWDEYHDINKIIDVGTSVCASGYLHGAQQAMSEDNSLPTNQLIANLVQVCNEITNNSEIDNNYRSCFHGIGHAVYLRSQNDFSKGIAICRTLSDSTTQAGYDSNFTKRELCSEGLTMRYMESIVQDVKKYRGVIDVDKKTTDVNLNPFILCNNITEKSLRYGCFSYGTRAFTHDDPSWLRATNLCNFYDENDQVPCYYGLSRELAYTPTTDTIRNVTKFCNSAIFDLAAYHCGVNAILNRITINNDLSSPSIVCGKLPATNRTKMICDYVKNNIRPTEGEVTRNIK